MIYFFDKVPITTFRLYFKYGSTKDEKGKFGLNFLTLNMLKYGTKNLLKKEFDEKIDLLGGTFGVHSGREYSFLSGSVLSSNYRTFMKYFKEAWFSPRLSAEEFEKLKKITVNEIQNIKDSDSHLTDVAFELFLYKKTPYAHPVYGVEKSVLNITIDDVRKNFEQLKNLKIYPAFVSDIRKNTVVSEISEFNLDDFANIKTKETPVIRKEWTKKNEVLIVNKRGRTQAQIRIGILGVNFKKYRNHYKVFNTIFGRDFTSKLSQELREKRGLTYGAYSYFSAYSGIDSFAITLHTRIDQLKEALFETKRLFEDVVKNGITHKEVLFAKKNLLNKLYFIDKTKESKLWFHVRNFLSGRGKNYYNQYKSFLRNLKSSDEVNSIVYENFKDKGLKVVITCEVNDEILSIVNSVFNPDSIKTVDYEEWDSLA